MKKGGERKLVGVAEVVGVMAMYCGYFFHYLYKCCGSVAIHVTSREGIRGIVGVAY